MLGRVCQKLLFGRTVGAELCRKEMINDRCGRRESDLLRLPWLTLRLVIGVLMGHVQLNHHLSIMGLVNDPSCNQCSVAIETASHFLCQCVRFITLWKKVWGKSHLHPADWPCNGQGSGEIYKEISQIHPEAIIASSYNWGTSGDGWWAQPVV